MRPRGRRDPAQVPPPHLGPDGALLRRPLRQPRGPLQVDLDPRRPRPLLGLLRGRAGQGGRLRLPALLARRQRQLLAPPRARGDGRVDRQGRPVLRERGRGGAAASTSSSTSYALILVADHAQTDVDRGLPLAELLGREWSVLAPSDDRPEQAQLAVSPTGRAAHVYLLAGEGERAEPRRGAAAPGGDRRASTWSAGWRTGAEPARWPSVERRAGRARSSCASGPATQVRDLRGGGWELDGDPAVLDGRRSRTAACAARSTRTRWPGSSPRSRSPARRRLRRLPGARLRGGRLGRRHPRRRRQPRRRCTAATASARCSSSAAGRTTPTSASSGRCATSPRRAGALRRYEARAASLALSAALALLLLSAATAAAAERPPVDGEPDRRGRGDRGRRPRREGRRAAPRSTRT